MQNATLAGGVAVGTSAALVLGPGGAVALGVTSGLLSSGGFSFLQSWAEARFGLTDTCGVMHLHGNPGLLAGFASMIAVAASSSQRYGSAAALAEAIPAMSGPGARSGATQAGYQLAFMLFSLGLAVAGGTATGHALRALEPGSKAPRVYFLDSR